MRGRSGSASNRRLLVAVSHCCSSRPALGVCRTEGRAWGSGRMRGRSGSSCAGQDERMAGNVSDGPAGGCSAVAPSSAVVPRQRGQGLCALQIPWACTTYRPGPSDVRHRQCGTKHHATTWFGAPAPTAAPPCHPTSPAARGGQQVQRTACCMSKRPIGAPLHQQEPRQISLPPARHACMGSCTCNGTPSCNCCSTRCSSHSQAAQLTHPPRDVLHFLAAVLSHLSQHVAVLADQPAHVGKGAASRLWSTATWLPQHGAMPSLQTKQPDIVRCPAAAPQRACQSAARRADPHSRQPGRRTCPQSIPPPLGPTAAGALEQGRAAAWAGMNKHEWGCPSSPGRLGRSAAAAVGLAQQHIQTHRLSLCAYAAQCTTNHGQLQPPAAAARK